LVELANASEKYTIEMTYETFDSNHFETFEKIMEKDNIDILMENILNSKHIIDDNQNSITIALGEGFSPLGLFRDIHSKKNNSQHYFLVIQDLFNVHIKKIAQAKLRNVHRKFAYHIINIYFITIKNLIHFILSFA
jgi:hypothetical protein